MLRPSVHAVIHSINLVYFGLFQAEVIRHENKLWNNDTLFLRDFVLVPVTPGNESLIGSCCEIVTGKDQVVVPCWYSKGSCNSKYGNELIGRSMCGNMGRASPLAAAQRTEDPIEILKKYDANIAKLKVDVEKMMINAGLVWCSLKKINCYLYKASIIERVI